MRGFRWCLPRVSFHSILPSLSPSQRVAPPPPPLPRKLHPVPVPPQNKTPTHPAVSSPPPNKHLLTPLQVLWSAVDWCCWWLSDSVCGAEDPQGQGPGGEKLQGEGGGQTAEAQLKPLLDGF